MRTFFAAITILSATVNNDNDTIVGKAFDNDISIDYTVKLSEANQLLYIPGAVLVVTGSLRIDRKQISSVIVWIDEIIHVGSVPEPEIICVESIPEPEAIAVPAEILDAPTKTAANLVEVPAEPVASKARKSNKRKALVTAEAELIPF